MEISFAAYGMDFAAVVEFLPGTPSSWWDPGDQPEVTFLSLEVHGRDASFLLDSDLWPMIYEKALDACAEESERQAAEALADLAADREWEGAHQ